MADRQAAALTGAGIGCPCFKSHVSCRVAKSQSYTITLESDPPARMRVRFTTVAGAVAAFVVQLEVFERTVWEPVIRYDGAHGFAHRDRYRRNGQQRKEPLNLNYADALTYGISDIRTSWQTYLERFARGDFA